MAGPHNYDTDTTGHADRNWTKDDVILLGRGRKVKSKCPSFGGSPNMRAKTKEGAVTHTRDLEGHQPRADDGGEARGVSGSPSAVGDTTPTL